MAPHCRHRRRPLPALAVTHPTHLRVLKPCAGCRLAFFLWTLTGKSEGSVPRDLDLCLDCQCAQCPLLSSGQWPQAAPSPVPAFPPHWARAPPSPRLPPHSYVCLVVITQVLSRTAPLVFGFDHPGTVIHTTSPDLHLNLTTTTVRAGPASQVYRPHAHSRPCTLTPPPSARNRPASRASMQPFPWWRNTGTCIAARVGQWQ